MTDPNNKKNQPSVKKILLSCIGIFLFLVILGYIGEWYL